MILALFVLALVLFLFYHFHWKRRPFPPGPVPIPLYGNTLEIGRNPPGYVAFERWTKQYGPIFTVWFGEVPCVVVTDYGIIKDTFQKEADAFAGRHFLSEISKALPVVGGLYGISRPEGEDWRKVRRFSTRALNALGMSGMNNELEESVMRIVEMSIKEIEDEKANGITEHRIWPLAELVSGSAASKMVFGCIYTKENIGDYHRLRALIDRVQKILISPTTFVLFSSMWLRYIPPFSTTFWQMEESFRCTYKYIEDQIEQRRVVQKAHLDAGEEFVDENYIDLFLKEIATVEADPNNTDEGAFNIKQLINACFDLWAAGFETTSSTIAFIVLYLLLDQRSQQKVHVEIDKFLQTERDEKEQTAPIKLSDRPKLPFLNAVICETQRVCNLLPVNLLHKTMSDVKIGRFSVRKGTPVLPQISSVLFDERIFPSPLDFRPERFLDENGQLKKVDALIPFGIGRRQCIGEPLAKMELFLFTANFFRKFWVLPVDPLNPPSSEKLMSLSVIPHDFYCRIELRNP